jgi:hypothetical protein
MIRKKEQLRREKKINFPFFIILYFQCSSSRWEPQISVLCEAGQQYLPQYLSEDGRWTSELSVKVPGVSCLRDKMDLLDYCKKVSFYLLLPLECVPAGISLLLHVKESTFRISYIMQH